MKLFNKVAIIGVGLIGGSLGLALRKKGLAKEVVGFFRRKKTLAAAKNKRLVTKATMSLKEAVLDADLIILATPVETIIKMIPRIKKLARNDAIVIDVGSTKSKIVKECEKRLRDKLNFIGCHPLAGSQMSGPQAADSMIFKNSICIITTTKKTDKVALAKIERLWQALGVKPKTLSPARHDKILAFTSHLAHIIAFSLVDSIPHKYLGFIGSGFRDTTRLASSNPVLWRDICLSNRREILEAISEFQDSLAKFKAYISKKKFKRLEHDFSKAKKRRDVY
ncbi:MAG: prephenate dehydrogenase/arogenate dehydrogenase family protein [Candidatus Omnitrophota bacterium]